MKESIFLIISGAVIAVFTVWKPSFFWQQPKAQLMQKWLGEKGTSLLYFAVALGMMSLGTFLFVEAKSQADLDEIAGIYENGNYEESRIGLLDYLQKFPDNATAWTILGHTYLDLDSSERGLTCFRKAKSIDSSYAPAFSGLGMALARTELYDEALLAYEKANNLTPDEGYIIGNMASLADDVGDMDKAIAYGEKSIVLNPEDATLVANLSLYYHKAGEIKKRDDMFEKAKNLGYESLDGLQEIFADAEEEE